jgi:hypothetical protein
MHPLGARRGERRRRHAAIVLVELARNEVSTAHELAVHLVHQCRLSDACTARQKQKFRPASLHAFERLDQRPPRGALRSNFSTLGN